MLLVLGEEARIISHLSSSFLFYFFKNHITSSMFFPLRYTILLLLLLTSRKHLSGGREGDVVFEEVVPLHHRPRSIRDQQHLRQREDQRHRVVEIGIPSS